MRVTSLLLIFAGLLFPAVVFAETAFDIVDKSDEQMRGESSYSVATMRIIRPDWTRSMSMKSWTKGRRFLHGAGDRSGKR